VTDRLPTYFVSHGGGPWPFMKGQYGATYDKLEASLADIRRQVGVRPKAVLVVSGHWEERKFTVSCGAAPGMIYDYAGFPAHTYQVKYPAPGQPQPAARVAALLRDEGVLVIGSGLSFHNLRQFGPAGRLASHQFDGWLQHVLLALTPAERRVALLHWGAAPYARMAHPREEHLLPLMVAFGAAEREPASCVYHEDGFFGSLAVSSFRFGACAAAQPRSADSIRCRACRAPRWRLFRRLFRLRAALFRPSRPHAAPAAPRASRASPG
jgi:aromatic ring-opening dioxygenase catalytic subunit (LigB family)